MSHFSAREPLMRLTWVETFARDIYRDADRARAFLSRPHAMLVGKRPHDVVLASGADTNVVNNLLGRAAYGGGV